MSKAPVFKTAAGILVGLLFLFPLFWTVVTALDSKNQVFSLPPSPWPAFDLHPLEVAWAAEPWVRYFLNTFFVSGMTVLLVLVTSSLTGYALATFRMPGRELWLYVVLGVLMVPQEALLIPDYVLLYHLHLLNTYTAQILPFAANALGIYLFYQFFRSLPVGFWEAARVDGAGRLRYLVQVALPLAKPVTMTVMLLTFVSSFTAFQWPLVLTQSSRIQPVEVGLSYFQGFDGTHWRELAAASAFTTLPIVLLFLFTQRYFVEGAGGRQGGIRE